MKLLSRSFFARDTAHVAQDLLGKIIVRNLDDSYVSGRIVETEAYTSYDPASHTFIGKTERNRAMFESVGHAYIYFIYGMYYGFNVVAHDNKTPGGGVLVRALEPLEGINIMQKYRHSKDVINLTNGPGKLTKAFHITKHQYGIDLTKKGEIYLVDDGYKPKKIVATERIGISKAQDVKWRFVDAGSDFLSRKLKR